MTTAPDSPAVPKDMERWLGNGGMTIIGAIGASLDRYGTERDGWVEGSWTPTSLACNPHGIVQAGVHSVLLDASMNFAINAGLAGKDRTRATLEMKTETLRVARAGDVLTLRGEVVRQAKQVAYAEGRIRDADGRLVSRATGTFLLHRV
ncbi:MAG: hypothetical protein NVSMB4_12610 [Acidimicrobiales bacterium]